MLPKVIHYCWFGKNPKNKLIKKCIKSWEKYCPDFKIIEWNEDNYDVFANAYCKEAYENKMWAFVSDYARHDILYKHGGIYLDTDVELLKPLDDELLSQDFVGFESIKYVNSGLIFGASANNLACKQMLDSYESDRFILSNGCLNKCTVCERMTKILLEQGLVLDNTCQYVNGLKIYDSSYFNPLGVFKDGKIQEHSYSIHHYNCSWHSRKEKLISFLGVKNTQKIIKILKFLKIKK